MGAENAYNNFLTCRQCKGLMHQVSPPDQSPLIMECRACGHQEQAEIHIGPEGFFAGQELEYRRVLIYRQGEKATAAEVQAIRKLVPELGRLPMHEAVRRIEEGPCIDLGFHPLEEARTLVEEVAAHGLDVRLVPTEEDRDMEQNRQRFFGPFGAPVSVGEPGQDTLILPFGLLALLVVILLIVLVVFLL